MYLCLDALYKRQTVSHLKERIPGMVGCLCILPPRQGHRSLPCIFIGVRFSYPFGMSVSHANSHERCVRVGYDGIGYRHHSWRRTARPSSAPRPATTSSFRLDCNEFVVSKQSVDNTIFQSHPFRIAIVTTIILWIG